MLNNLNRSEAKQKREKNENQLGIRIPRNKTGQSFRYTLIEWNM